MVRLVQRVPWLNTALYYAHCKWSLWGKAYNSERFVMNDKAWDIVTDTFFYQLYLWRGHVKSKGKGYLQETWKEKVSLIWFFLPESRGFPGGSVSKESACVAGDTGDSWVRKICWRWAWQPTHYSCLENPMHRGAWWATVHGVAESWTRLKWLSTHSPTWELPNA